MRERGRIRDKGGVERGEEHTPREYFKDFCCNHYFYTFYNFFLS